jgi:hypothetical protein
MQKKKLRKSKAKVSVKTTKAKRHPKQPAVRKRGNRIDFTKTKRIDSDDFGPTLEAYNKLPWLKCPQCKRKGKKSVWNNGDIFFTHRLKFLEDRLRTTDFCYIGRD